MLKVLTIEDCFSSPEQSGFPSLFASQTFLDFTVLFGSILSNLICSLKFFLEFSGLHYCLFVKVLGVFEHRTEKEGFEPSRRY